MALKKRLIEKLRFITIILPPGSSVRSPVSPQIRGEVSERRREIPSAELAKENTRRNAADPVQAGKAGREGGPVSIVREFDTHAAHSS